MLGLPATSAIRAILVGNGRNRTSCPKGPRLQRGDGTSPVLIALPIFGCGSRGCTGPSRLMRPRGFLTDLPAQIVRGLLIPSLAAGTSAVSRTPTLPCPACGGGKGGGGCLTCRSPHLAVPSRFERAPEAALVRHPCRRKAAVSIRSGNPPDRFPSDADRPIG